jgi:CO dehydrogenase/acetyl-CoA synthase gamma subunit (corrinoid Fe-S protein)
MNRLKYLVVNILETLLRVLPIPCKVGLKKIGKPNRTSPVFLTCNYHLTEKRVQRALRKIDCYLLVANSHGHNV